MSEPVRLPVWLGGQLALTLGIGTTLVSEVTLMPQLHKVLGATMEIPRTKGVQSLGARISGC